MSARGAYIDENSVRWDTNDADFEGMLMKKSKWMGVWRQRYFILKGSKLFFSEGPSAAPHGMIDLVDCMSVQSAEIKAKKKNAMEIVLKANTFYLIAKNDREKDDWIGQIGKAIVKYSSMYISDEDGEDLIETHSRK